MKNQNIAFMLKREQLKHVSTEEERIEILQELVNLNPKDPRDLKLRAGYKKELGILRRKTGSKGRHMSFNPFDSFRYDQQVVIVGETNSGRSTLLRNLTDSRPDVTETPFTTYKPEVGLFTFNDIPIHMIEVPPLYEGDNDRKKGNFIRNSDVICIAARNKSDAERAISVLEDYLIIIYGNHSESKKHKNRPNDEIIQKPTFIAAWDDFDYDGCNTVDISSPEAVGEEIYRLLGIKRVYCVRDGKRDGSPLIFSKDQDVTVRDFVDRLGLNTSRMKNARIYGSLDIPDGRIIGMDYVLKDGDGVNFK